MMLELDGLTHRYGNETAVTDVSFEVDSEEVVAVLGPSGCGKTTIVQTIAGHVRPTAGRIRLRERDVTDDPPETRDVGVVFQEPSLFPHLTAAENVAYGLHARGVGSVRRDETVTQYLELVSLEAQRHAHPSELSGGQKRRVELARALAPEPDLLLLDEPLSALDRALREQLRDEIARIQGETGVTTLYVTHDQEEAMALADRLVVMTDGRIAGVGRPRDLYESPPTPFVASFLGRSNRLPVDGNVDTNLPDALGDGPSNSHDTAETDSANGAVSYHVRPADVTLDDPDSNDADVCLPGVVTRVCDIGRRYDVTVRLETGDDLTVEHRGEPPAAGDPVTAKVDSADVTRFEDPDSN